MKAHYRFYDISDTIFFFFHGSIPCKSVQEMVLLLIFLRFGCTQLYLSKCTPQGRVPHKNKIKIKTHNRIINVLLYTLSLSYSQIRLQGRWWGWSQITRHEKILVVFPLHIHYLFHGPVLWGGGVLRKCGSASHFCVYRR